MCILCDGLSDGFRNIKDLYNIDRNVILFETKNFKIIPDKFPISENHIIILPKRHINTFAEFNKNQQLEVYNILSRIENTTKSLRTILFEHGTSPLAEQASDPYIKSIFHAHLHFIPNIEWTTKNVDDFFTYKQVEILNNYSKQHGVYTYETRLGHKGNVVKFIRDNAIFSNGQLVESYLYIKNSDDTQLFFPDKYMKPTLPSQFLREALSVKCNTPEWDWKIPMSDKAISIYRKRIINMLDTFNVR